MDNEPQQVIRQRRSIAQRSVDAQILIDLLAKMFVGQTITYEELSRAIGRDVRAEARSALYTARRRVLCDLGISTECVTGIGIVRLDQAGTVERSGGFMKKSRRAAQRSVLELVRGVTEFDQLTDSQKAKHNMTLSLSGAIANMTKPKKVKKLTEEVQKSQQRLSLGATLDALK